MQTIQTVGGPCAPADLGVALMHEHLLIGWPGWEAYASEESTLRRERVTVCVDRMQELRELGVRTLLDPCPIDLGRDVELMAEVAERGGVRIICATGLYKEETGAPAYFKFRQQFGDAVEEMTELFVRELTVGIGSTGIRAGVIKVATGPNQVTAYEELVLRAAARAHRATGAPITTHTDDGTMGPEQLAILTAEGVAPAAVVIGHSCGSADLRYHTDMLDTGAFLGFDRFGLELLHPDRARIAALTGLLGLGFERQLVLSHDTVWCWRGRAPQTPPGLLDDWQPTHLFRHIIPRLRDAGVSQAKIDTMLIENPRRYFAEAGTTRC
jgi:phosphotriesterase-related protein